MREAEHFPKSLHRDRPEAANFSEVISAEVHEHIVLGEFLFVREQLSLEGRILLRTFAARSRAGQREGVQFAVFEFDQRLRRSTRNL